MRMVDGTFLMGRHRGVLLSAVGKDGDEGKFFVYCCNCRIPVCCSFCVKPVVLYVCSMF